jgi:hypothetical protein
MGCQGFNFLNCIVGEMEAIETIKFQSQCPALNECLKMVVVNDYGY